jgi:mRNA deadenylase 3'-5' endonuclease subunit Ccr4
MAKTTGPDRVKKFVKVLKGWQALERKAMADTGEVAENTRSPLIRMIMAIIRHDSLMHHQVQQLLIDSVTEQALTVTREDVAEVWEQIEKHDALERKTLELAAELKEQAWTPAHKQLLDYLITDENKHTHLLEQLNELKSGMTGASGA